MQSSGKFLKLLLDREVPKTNEPVKKTSWSNDCSTSYVLNLWDYRPSSPSKVGVFFFLTIQQPVRHEPSETTWRPWNGLLSWWFWDPQRYTVRHDRLYFESSQWFQRTMTHDHKTQVTISLSVSSVLKSMICVMQRKKYTAWFYMSLHGVYLGLLVSDDLLRYGLPLKVIEILVAHFCAFATEDRVLPLVPWPVDEGWLQEGPRNSRPFFDEIFFRENKGWLGDGLKGLWRGLLKPIFV